MYSHVTCKFTLNTYLLYFTVRQDDNDDSDDDLATNADAFNHSHNSSSRIRLKIQCKDAREFLLVFSDDTLAEGCYQTIKEAWGTPEDRLFALLHHDHNLTLAKGEAVACSGQGTKNFLEVIYIVWNFMDIIYIVVHLPCIYVGVFVSALSEQLLPLFF